MSSSAGSRPVKKYSSQKRKREATGQAGDESASEEEIVLVPSPSKQKSKASPKGDMKPPSFIPPSPTPISKTKTPKKVDVHLPGPSPKRRREDDELSEAKSKKSGMGHHRSTSSMSSIARAGKSSEVSASPASNKPISSSGKLPIPLSRLAPSSKREPSPETEQDDDASVAESSISMSGGNRIRRTEAERIEYFKNQPDAGAVEPNRVECTRCNKSISLGKKQTYSVRPWEQHRAKCDQKVPVTLYDGKTPDDASSIAPSNASVRRSEPERKAILEADSRAEVVQHHQILCKKCRKWVKLSNSTRYAMWPWQRHQDSCSGAVPSSRVAAAERKIQIFNDACATSKGPHDVKCNGCGENVKLEGEGDYNLTKWNEHRESCAKAQALLKLKARAVRPSPSVASTEATAVAPEASSSSPPNRNAKRKRDDADLPSSNAEGPLANRPRNENYVPIDKDAPGPFGWFMMPFKAFWKGFKESLTTESTA